MSQIYLRDVLSQVPRLLSLLDTNPSTNTYGCFDREYWHYNTTDIACARKQEAVLSLALLYQTKNKENIYYNNKKILEWLNAALEFWTRIQDRNGSFNEWYPNEHSFVATAFSCYAVSETLLLLKEKIINRNSIIKCLEKSADWLSGKYEHRVQNQQSGAAIALLNIYFLTKKKKYLKDSERKINELIKNQTKEDWWMEYNGPDIGYLSLTIDYLTKYYNKHPNENLKNTIKKAIDFISYFIHPDYTSGGCYGSRNTEYLIPSGFEAMTGLSKKAASISYFIRKGIEERKTISPSSLDDRYLSYIGYNWLQAFMNAKEIKENGYRFQEEFTKDFKIAKIYIHSNKHYYFILNYNKGTFRAFFKKTGNAYNDSGILIEKEKQACISGLSGSVNNILYKKNNIILKGNMKKLSKKILKPFKNILLRLFQLTIGSSEKISLNVKEKLRDKLITESKNTEIEFRREIYLKENSIRVLDKIDNINSTKRIIVGDKFSYLFVPSANYFQQQDIIASNDMIPLIKKDGSIKISRNLI